MNAFAAAAQPASGTPVEIGARRSDDRRSGKDSRSRRAQPPETPNAASASATIVPEIKLQQPAMAKPTASAKTLSTCSAGITPHYIVPRRAKKCPAVPRKT